MGRNCLLIALLLLSTGSLAQRLQGGKVRTYYIAADDVTWDYTPGGRNLAGLPRLESSDEGAGNQHRIYPKAVYHEYTDGAFKTEKPRPPEWQHLGILGPLIRAEVGDTIRVFFRNNTKHFCTMHPHGLAYDKNSEGASYNDGTSGDDKADDAVPPGGSHTYTWTVPERAGPGPGDPSSILWMYHSHFNEPKDVNTGLVGPIIISARGSTKPDGTPKDVDREFVAAFAVFDETDSWYFHPDPKWPRSEVSMRLRDPVFRELNTAYSINGLLEGNLPGLTMKKGERVRWYLFASANEDDVHTVHWHGQTAVVMHMRTDAVPLTPMSMAVADMVPDKVGTWLLHCHVNDHLKGGMVALFTVTP